VASVDDHNLHLAIVADLDGEAAIQAIIGDPVRVRMRPERNLAYPWVRLWFDPGTNRRGTMGSGAGTRWIYERLCRMRLLSQDTGLAAVADLKKLIADRMEAFPTNGVITDATCTQCIPYLDQIGYSPENQHAYADLGYRLWVEPSA